MKAQLIAIVAVVVLVGCGIFVSLNLSVSLRNSAGQWDCGPDPLNFPESGWWGRILSSNVIKKMKK